MDLKSIFNLNSEKKFSDLAIEIFHIQFENNPVYRSFCDLLNINSSDVQKIEDIPFLPINFFKTHTVKSTKKKIKKTFLSSGTTNKNASKHYLTNPKIYRKSFRKCFEFFYGPIKDYVILALLPSYLERNGSSLVYMVNDMIVRSKKPQSGFYLNNLKELKDTIQELDQSGQKTILIGVSFALLDLIEFHQFNLKNTIIMETGGMKGQRKELIKSELHEYLKKGFGVQAIHSEYGMTEILSQAYSKNNGLFKTPPWMKILIRDTEDALSILPIEKSGGINIIDLANIDSCAFIATQDLGMIHKNGYFELLGRFDQSEVRGCNLMVV